MPPKITNPNDIQSLLALLQITQAEITRYRDRGWANVALFTGSLVAVIGLVLAYRDVATAHVCVITLVLWLLAIGNVFYTLYVHNRLTDQRLLRSKIEDALGVRDIDVNGKKPFEVYLTPAAKQRWQVWLRGFPSHLEPFFLVGLGLAVFGTWLLKS